MDRCCYSSNLPLPLTHTVEAGVPLNMEQDKFLALMTVPSTLGTKKTGLESCEDTMEVRALAQGDNETTLTS